MQKCSLKTVLLSLFAILYGTVSLAQVKDTTTVNKLDEI
jgi:hypothetical protein